MAQLARISKCCCFFDVTDCQGRTIVDCMSAAQTTVSQYRKTEILEAFLTFLCRASVM